MFNQDSSRKLDLTPLLDPDQRLVFSGLPVFLLFSLLFSHFYFQIHGSRLTPLETPLTSPTAWEEKVYPVLVEQKFRPRVTREQMRALSDVSAAGTGFLTEKSGFHTLTNYDTLSFSQSGKSALAGRGERGEREQEQESEKSPSWQEREGDLERRSHSRSSPSSASGEPSPRPGDEKHFTIPANYRFQQDMALRYDDSPRLSVARQELAGFRYFQQMLRQIRDTFAPPGMNYAYRDAAGYVVNQPIKPQEVRVLFALDSRGYVRDVRVVSSMGQEAVDEACINVLRGKNFGPPPEEVLSRGNIFGINFIFPPVWNR